jgi:hypothetical protein
MLRTLSPTRTRATLLAVSFSLFQLGCAGKVPQLNSDLPTPELKVRLAAGFHPGMTLPEVNDRLSGMDVPWNVRHAYAGDPPQLLVRLFPRGGYWVTNSEYQRTRYVDAWFIFTRESPPALAAIDLDERVMRIGAGTYIDPPFHDPSLLPSSPRPVPAGVGAPERDWISIGGIS